MKKKIGIVDTTFARINMGQLAENKIKQIVENNKNINCETVRVTVPGFKDLAVACQILLDEQKCDFALALGWVGGMPIDEQCAHEAALAIAMAQLMCKKHILHIFVHESEAKDEAEANRSETLCNIAIDRVQSHAQNAIWMLFEPEIMIQRAGQGCRQGGPSVGPIAK